MDPCVGSSLYPFHRCKILHLVRHAQGYHNLAGLTDENFCYSNEYFDASLTPLGWQQVEHLRKHVTETGILSNVELVVTSPLLRTMQTAAGVFGGGSTSDDDQSVPLMLSDSANNYASISSLGCPPFVAMESCREHLGVYPCDKRRRITEYRSIFPAIDFSLIETDQDSLWLPDIREKEEEIAARGKDFFNWLLTRKEREIAVVSHGGFLRHTLAQCGNDCHLSVQEEVHKEFANCELRSLVLVDKSSLGTNISSTNYPGGILNGTID